MRPTTRLRILDHLRKHQTASVRDLSRLLGMTGANIRHHLAVLVSNDLIEIVGQDQDGRGRPMKVYGLSQHVLGDGLGQLSGALLEEWLGQLSDREQEVNLRSVARRLAQVSQSPVAAPLLQRLSGAVDRLNQLHYQARWEASAAGARLILGHCPYAAIIGKYPELCRVDAFLLEACLGQEVEQTSKLERLGRGLPQCIFLVH